VSGRVEWRRTARGDYAVVNGRAIEVEYTRSRVCRRAPWVVCVWYRDEPGRHGFRLAWRTTRSKARRTAVRIARGAGRGQAFGEVVAFKRGGL
jgi:hypothetical protein